MLRHLAPFALPVFCVLLFGGCGPSGSGFEVNGNVTLNGEPLSGAQVDFFPVEGGTSLSATTNDEGEYSIRSTVYSGQTAGQYKVVLTKYAPRDPSAGQMTMDRVNVIPIQYTDRTKTPLSAELKPGTNNLPTFALEGTVEEPKAEKPKKK
jgi:hypothetical protein